MTLHGWQAIWLPSLHSSSSEWTFWNTLCKDLEQEGKLKKLHAPSVTIRGVGVIKKYIYQGLCLYSSVSPPSAPPAPANPSYTGLFRARLNPFGARLAHVAFDELFPSAHPSVEHVWGLQNLLPLIAPILRAPPRGGGHWRWRLSGAPAS